MREPAAWWNRLGRLLPREIRERVYEPACYERLRDAIERSGRPSVGIYPIGAFIGTAGRNVPRIWLDGRTLSGLSRVLLITGVVVVGAWLLLFGRYYLYYYNNAGP